MKFIIQNLIVNTLICALCSYISVAFLLTPTSSVESDTMNIISVFAIAYVCGWVARGYFDRQNSNVNKE